MFDRRQSGTGEWLLGHDLFKKRLDGSERVLRCPGIRTATFLDFIPWKYGLLTCLKLALVKLCLRTHIIPKNLFVQGD